MSKLFTPFQIGNLTLSNRIVVAPMCQYSAEHGYPTAWHAQHLGMLAQSGAGLVIVEATAVQENGRISPADLGLWSDDQQEHFTRLLADIRRYSPAKIGVQLAHAGRKASHAAPWEGGGDVDEKHGGWQTVAPSALAFGNARPPRAMSLDDIAQLKQDFVNAARRAEQAGYDMIELHAAHGYLLHQFLSPLSNQRNDQYGGSLENRLRLILEVFHEVSHAVSIPTGVRVSATDWVDGGWDLESTRALAIELEKLGCTYLHVSSGGLSPEQQITVSPNYQVPFARELKRSLKMPVMAVGLITEPEQAEAIVATGEADAIALARGILYDPRWPWHAAARLKATIEVAPQYRRSEPHQARGTMR
ncbi:oxidoreductase [Salmonella enterica subsp. enterica serovar Choleraesuis]|nr:oxidoreductase [Salmonella enterica subsp. enterica serovar Choleraesuis]